MTLQRRRYSRIPVGALEALPDTVSRARSGRELYAELWLCSLRRTLPGVLRTGEAALAELLDWPLPTLRRRLRELESADLISFDRPRRVLQVRAAIPNDPPRGSRTVAIAMFRDLRELPPESPVTQAIEQDLERAIAGSDFERVWREVISESDAHSGIESGAQSGGESGTHSGVVSRDPRDPRSEDPGAGRPRPGPVPAAAPAAPRSMGAPPAPGGQPPAAADDAREQRDERPYMREIRLRIERAAARSTMR